LLGIIGADLAAERRWRLRGQRGASLPHTRPPHSCECAFTHVWGPRRHTRRSRVAECAVLTQGSSV